MESISTALGASKQSSGGSKSYSEVGSSVSPRDIKCSVHTASMKHYKKNLTSAETSSVHKLNCALPRNFLTDRHMLQKKYVQNCITMSHGYFYHESHMCSDCPAEYLGSLNSHIGSIKNHINSLGPSQETYKETTKTKTSSFVRKIYVHWNLTRWEK